MIQLKARQMVNKPDDGQSMIENSPDTNSSSNVVDIAIIGGGIAGLWTLARLCQSGYQAILLEADHLGCAQSGASQGIIHGGTKYALTGKLTHSSQSIQEMPQRWKDCLDGHGEVDLSQARKLSSHQYLWSNKSLASRLTGFFASKVMSSRMQHLLASDYVPPFDCVDFKGELYQLDEPVLDIQSVVETIRKQYEQLLFQANVDEINLHEGVETSLRATYQLKAAGQNITITARTVILTAGAGNEKLLASLNLEQPEMQRRPLFMPMLKAKSSLLPKMYAHCLGASALPKMTITSYYLPADNKDNETQVVWYLGGEIAEKGINRSIEEQVFAAKQNLQTLMPWMNFSQCQWSALAIDRAEPKMPDGSRPVEPAVFRHNNVITAWPVKLAMTPIMVDKIVTELQQAGVPKNSQPAHLLGKKLDDQTMTDLAPAQTARLPWEKVQNWL